MEEAADLTDSPHTMTPFAYTFTVDGGQGIPFRRGDANGDGRTDLSDGIFTLLYLFGGRQGPPCGKSGDANDDGVIDTADVVFVLSFLFADGAPVPAPGGACGTDPTPDALSCAAYPPCR